MILEEQLISFLQTQLPNEVFTIGVKPAASASVPVNLSTLFNLGGPSEEILRFRIITRGNTYLSTVNRSTDIFNALHRKNNFNLPNIIVYMLKGEGIPGFIGQEEDQSFLMSGDYELHFSRLI